MASVAGDFYQRIDQKGMEFAWNVVANQKNLQKSDQIIPADETEFDRERKIILEKVAKKNKIKYRILRISIVVAVVASYVVGTIIFNMP